ncbi:MAG: ATP-binding cassette domain-containing protein, partial [Anaeroplasmataceae bacterium]
GKSGSGKSTFLNVVGGLDKYDSGEIIIRGKSSAKFSQADFDSYRNTYVGFIFQEYYILKEFSVGKNIQLAIELQNKKSSKDDVNALLDQVGLANFYNRKPNELSGGQKQRIAIARALIKNPQIIMADEPTGALDSNTGKQVLDTLKDLSKDRLVIVVSHDREFAENYADRIIEFADGQIISDSTKESFESVKLTPNVEIIDDKIIHIKKGVTLTVNDTKAINDLMKNNDTDAYISIDKNANSKFKRAARISDEDKSEKFVATTDKNLSVTNYSSSDFKSIKSRLPLFDSFKMGASSLFNKKIRLFITILLASFAFTLFGVANTAASYNKEKVTYNSIINNGIKQLGLSKYEKSDKYGYEQNDLVKMSQKDIDKLKLDFPTMKFSQILNPGSTNYGISISSNFHDNDAINSYNGYYTNNIGGYSVLDLETVLINDFKLEGSIPKALDEVVIPKYYAEAFVKADYSFEDKKVEINEVSDMIGKELVLPMSIDKVKAKVVGIIDTNLDKERYKKLIDNNSNSYDKDLYQLSSELDILRKYSSSGLFYISPELFKQQVDNESKFFELASGYGPDDVRIDSTMINGVDKYYRKVLKYSENNYDITYKSNVSKLSKNQILMQKDEFARVFNYELGGDSSIENIKSFLDSNPVKFDINYKIGYSEDINSATYDVVGIYTDKFDYFDLMMTNDDLMTYVDTDVKSFSGVMVNYTSKDDLNKLISFSYKSNGNTSFNMETIVTPTLEMMNSIAEQVASILVWVALVFCIFAGLLLMNFITVSIASKKNDIGILRAIGARSNDVVKIFFFESLLISLINFVLATVFTIIAVIGFNMMVANLGINITFLSFGLTQILLLLGVSLLVAFIASFLPVKNITRLRPIDAIKK